MCCGMLRDVAKCVWDVGLWVLGVVCVGRIWVGGCGGGALELYSTVSSTSAATH